MYLRDVVCLFDIDSVDAKQTLKARGRCFSQQAACTADMFRAYLPKMRTNGTAKVIVDAVPDHAMVTEANIRRRLDVTYVPQYVQLDKFERLETPERKRFVLETIRAALLWAARVEGWEKAPIEESYSKCLELNLEHNFFWKKGKVFWNASHTVGFRAMCEYDLDEARYFLIFRCSKCAEQDRVFLYSSMTVDVIVYGVLQSLRWESDETVACEVWEASGEWRVQFDIATKQFDKTFLRR